MHGCMAGPLSVSMAQFSIQLCCMQPCGMHTSTDRVSCVQAMRLTAPTSRMSSFGMHPQHHSWSCCWLFPQATGELFHAFDLVNKRQALGHSQSSPAVHIAQRVAHMYEHVTVPLLRICSTSVMQYAAFAQLQARQNLLTRLTACHAMVQL